MNFSKSWSSPFVMNQWQRESSSKTKFSLGSASLSLWSLQEIFDLASPSELSSWNNQKMQYSDIQGGAELRSLISQQYSNLSADNIVVFSGAQEGLTSLYLALLGSESQVLGISPSYTPMNLAISKSGAQFQELALSYLDKKWSLDFSLLNKKIREGLDLLVVNFPHNPTGFIPNKREWQKTLNHASESGSWVICDEVFKGLEFEKSKAIAPVCDSLPRGISVGSLSKSYGCPSTRIGWVATHDKELITKLITIKRYFSICSSFLDEGLAKVMIKNKEYVLDRNIKFLKNRFDLLDSKYKKKLSKWLEIDFTSGGIVLFPKLKNNLDSYDLCLDFLNKTGFRIEPSKCFGDYFTSHFRLGVGSNYFERGLEELSSFLAGDLDI